MIVDNCCSNKWNGAIIMYIGWIINCIISVVASEVAI